ncbi:MAG: sulfotransferase family protein [Actinobacteria bacterium]|nr:sulfotransferase family protein [Actinomycetota bacterium]
MPLQIVGAGLGRTGTTSLTAALEQLLGGRCYHFGEVFERPADIDVWHDIVRTGAKPDWRALFEGYEASNDWPAAAYWKDIAAAFPEARVLLSTRETADKWYASYSKTITPLLLDTARYNHPAHDMARAVTFATFTNDLIDPAAVKRRYEEHNHYVRSCVPSTRLIEWTPGDGWTPLCAALGLPEPEQEFPHLNTTDEFREGNKLNRKPPTTVKRVTRLVRRVIPKR